MIRFRLAMAAGALAIVAACGDPHVRRDADGTIVAAGELDPFALRVGDCFDDAPEAGAGMTEITALPGVPCSAAHDNEVFALVELDFPAREWPGPEPVHDAGATRCIERFEAWVGRDYPSSALNVFVLYPTEETWREQGDREIVCALHAMDGRPLEGSMRGTGF